LGTQRLVHVAVRRLHDSRAQNRGGLSRLLFQEDAESLPGHEMRVIGAVKSGLLQQRRGIVLIWSPDRRFAKDLSPSTVLR